MGPRRREVGERRTHSSSSARLERLGVVDLDVRLVVVRHGVPCVVRLAVLVQLGTAKKREESALRRRAREARSEEREGRTRRPRTPRSAPARSTIARRGP